MSAKFSKSLRPHLGRRIGLSIVLIVWLVVAFALAQLIVSALVWALVQFHVPLGSMNDAVLNSLVAALVYICSIVLVIGGPRLIARRTTTLHELGIRRWPSWMDMLLAPAGAVVYILLSGLFSVVAQHISGFNASQAQDIGFTHLSGQWQYFVAFFTLVVMAPVAEETLFRGYLYGKIRKRLPFVPTMLLVSLTFAALHIPGVNASGALQLQWNVALDVFALSLVLTSLREVTDNIWAGILLHALKNGLAFYFLFINPIMSTMGG